MSELEEWLPTEAIVRKFGLYTKMLTSLGVEIRELSKKKQEGTLNLTKVRMINRVLQPLKLEVLDHIPAHIFLDLLDEDALPNNSDAVLVISQFEAAIKEFDDLYHRRVKVDTFSTRSYWATVENPDGMVGYESEEEDDDYEEDDEDELEE